MEYLFRKAVHRKIRSFYRNVSKKYRNTYDMGDMLRDCNRAYDAIYGIENGLLRRTPTISRWRRSGWWMANTKLWYYAYRIEGETIYIEDTCHAQNMHEATQRGENLFSISTRKHIAQGITENVMRKIRQLI